MMTMTILWDWSLNWGLHACKTGTLPLEPYRQSILLLLFWTWGYARADLKP
jgi:hypothetical protein